jgi:acetone carboxylase gamma subunit
MEHLEYWKKRQVIRLAANSYLQLHFESIIEGHPHRNEMLKLMKDVKDDDQFLVLLSFLGHAQDQQQRVLQSIDASHEASYEILNARMAKIESFQQSLSQYQAIEVHEINNKLDSIIKNQKAIYAKLNKKSKFQRLRERVSQIFK